MKDQILVLMKRKLVVPIIEEELWSTLNAMAKGKAPRPNGVIVEFFLYMWLVMGQKYTKMIQDSIMNDIFFLRLQKG